LRSNKYFRHASTPPPSPSFLSDFGRWKQEWMGLLASVGSCWTQLLTSGSYFHQLNASRAMFFLLCFIVVEPIYICVAYWHSAHKVLYCATMQLCPPGSSIFHHYNSIIVMYCWWHSLCIIFFDNAMQTVASCKTTSYIKKFVTHVNHMTEINK
jgi:hypothetical protein